MSNEYVDVILSAYKRVLKENEKLKEDRDKFKKALGKRITYCNELEKDLFENCSNYVIPKQIVKDKIEEYCQKARERGEKEAKTIRSDNEKNVKELYDKALTLENEAVNKAVEEVMKF